jgi:hypothetical protein
MEMDWESPYTNHNIEACVPIHSCYFPLSKWVYQCFPPPITGGYVRLTTGVGKPAVFPKWVPWVRVQFSFLAHCGTLLPVPWYHGYVQVNYSKVNLILTVFFLIFFIVSHRDRTKYGSVSRAYILASNHQPALSSHSHSHPTSETM